VNSHFEHPLTHWFAVAKFAFDRTIKAQSKLGFPNMILQADQPSIEFVECRTYRRADKK
jgi:hypothetical protein